MYFGNSPKLINTPFTFTRTSNINAEAVPLCCKTKETSSTDCVKALVLI